MWMWFYFANGLNIEKIMKFLKSASNIYIICNWEIDQGWNYFRQLRNYLKKSETHVKAIKRILQRNSEYIKTIRF